MPTSPNRGRGLENQLCPAPEGSLLLRQRPWEAALLTGSELLVPSAEPELHSQLPPLPEVSIGHCGHLRADGSCFFNKLNYKVVAWKLPLNFISPWTFWSAFVLAEVSPLDQERSKHFPWLSRLLSCYWFSVYLPLLQHNSEHVFIQGTVLSSTHT